MAFDKDSLILINYIAKIKDTNEVFETTVQEEAERYNMYDPDATYQPKLVSIGNTAYPAIKGFDEALADATVGESVTVEVPPDKGFGERDKGKIRMVPERKLGDDADKIAVGDTVTIDKKPGIVRFIGSGRVQIDYNHKYAGKTILYDITVLRALETAHEKIEAIMGRHFRDADSLSLEITGAEATLTIPKGLTQDEGLYTMKFFTQMNAFKFVPELETFNFVETYNARKKIPLETAGEGAQGLAGSEVSDSAGSEVSDSAGSEVSDSAGSEVSDSAGSEVSDSAGSEVSDSAGSEVSDSAGESAQENARPASNYA